MKHTIRLAALALTVILAVLPLSVSAQQTHTEALEQVIIDSCLYDRTADLSEYDLTEDELETLFYSLKDTGRLPWYTGASYSFSYIEDTGVVVDFTPDNLDETAYDRTVYEQRVAEVLDACVFEGMSQTQIALSVHDYLVANTVYDESLTVRTGYELLVKGTTVCSGYTELYQDLLNRAGVPCVSVTSEPMEHTWNLVCIGGQWYHVDVTWDDPTPDAYGLVSHEYFLLTDAEIAAGEEPHYDWVTDITCTDTRFQDAYWRDISSGIWFESSEVSYLLREKDWSNYIYQRNEATGEETTLYAEDEPYVDIGHGDYSYTHLGLSYWNGRLYFASLDKVLSIDPHSREVRTEYRYDAQGNGRFLYGCFVTGDTAYLSLAEHDGETAAYTAKLTDSGSHVHSYTEAVQAPTCEEAGFTTSSCACGISCKSDTVAPTGHSYRQTEGRDATLFADGFSTEVCDVCSHTVTRELPQLDAMAFLRENLRLILAIVLAVVVLVSRIARRNRKVQV